MGMEITQLETKQIFAQQSLAHQHGTDMVVLTPMVMAPLMKTSQEQMALYGPLPVAQTYGPLIPLNGWTLTATDMVTILRERRPMLVSTMQAPRLQTDTAASTQMGILTQIQMPFGERNMVQTHSLQMSSGGLISTMTALPTKLMTTAHCTQELRPSIVSAVPTQMAMGFLTQTQTGLFPVMALTPSRPIQLKALILMVMDLATMPLVTLRTTARQKLEIHGKTAPWDVLTLTKMDGLTKKTRTPMT
jgi:hypothetical protein